MSEQKVERVVVTQHHDDAICNDYTHRVPGKYHHTHDGTADFLKIWYKNPSLFLALSAMRADRFHTRFREKNNGGFKQGAVDTYNKLRSLFTSTSDIRAMQAPAPGCNAGHVPYPNKHQVLRWVRANLLYGKDMNDLVSLLTHAFEPRDTWTTMMRLVRSIMLDPDMLTEDTTTTIRSWLTTNFDINRQDVSVIINKDGIGMIHRLSDWMEPGGDAEFETIDRCMAAFDNALVANNYPKSGAYLYGVVYMMRFGRYLNLMCESNEKVDDQFRFLNKFSNDDNYAEFRQFIDMLTVERGRVTFCYAMMMCFILEEETGANKFANAIEGTKPELENSNSGWKYTLTGCLNGNMSTVGTGTPMDDLMLATAIVVGDKATRDINMQSFAADPTKWLDKARALKSKSEAVVGPQH